MTDRAAGRWRRIRRGLALVALLLGAATLVGWVVGRATAGERRVVVRHLDGRAPLADADSGASELRIVAWNLAHGRGDDTTGWFANWTAGPPEARRRRLRAAAEALRRVEADVVVLNEVDFDAAWSGGTNQAEIVARAAGYPTWVEQRNFDLRVLFATFAFGNAVLSDLPVLDARSVELPVRSHLERRLAGAKAAMAVRLRTAGGDVTVVPVHLDYRGGPTRRAAAPVFDSLRAAEDGPVILAGDFNAAPPGWGSDADSTVLGRLLEGGWTSPRARSEPDRVEATWPTRAPRRALDWILVEPPLEVVEARVLEGVDGLSDHAPVLSVIRLPPSPPPTRR